jgi:hypothetical protein
VNSFGKRNNERHRKEHIVKTRKCVTLFSQISQEGRVHKVVLFHRGEVRVVGECDSPTSEKRRYRHKFHTIFFYNCLRLESKRSLKFGVSKPEIARQLRLFSMHSYDSAISVQEFA